MKKRYLQSPAAEFDFDRQPDRNRKSHSQVASFIVKEQLPFPVIEDIDGRLSTAFAVSSIPSTIIMAPDGRIITELKGVQSAASLEREARSALNKVEE